MRQVTGMNYRYKSTKIDAPGPAPMAHPDLKRDTDRSRHRALGTLEEGDPQMQVPSTKLSSTLSEHLGYPRNDDRLASEQGQQRIHFRPPATPLTKQAEVSQMDLPSFPPDRQVSPRVVAAAPLLTLRSSSPVVPVPPLPPFTVSSPVWAPRLVRSPSAGFSPVRSQRMSLPAERPQISQPSFHFQPVQPQPQAIWINDRLPEWSAPKLRGYQWSPPPLPRHHFDFPDESLQAAQKPLCMHHRSHANYFKPKTC